MEVPFGIPTFILMISIFLCSIKKKCRSIHTTVQPFEFTVLLFYFTSWLLFLQFTITLVIDFITNSHLSDSCSVVILLRLLLTPMKKTTTKTTTTLRPPTSYILHLFTIDIVVQVGLLITMVFSSFQLIINSPHWYQLMISSAPPIINALPHDSPWPSSLPFFWL